MEIGKLTLTVDTDKVFDELGQSFDDLEALAKLIPDEVRKEADVIIQRIFDRQLEWVKLETSTLLVKTTRPFQTR